MKSFRNMTLKGLASRVAPKRQNPAAAAEDTEHPSVSDVLCSEPSTGAEVS